MVVSTVVGCVVQKRFPLVYEVVDQPGLIDYQSSLSSELLGETELGFAYNYHANQGMVTGPTDTNTMIDRIVTEVATHQPSMVVVQATQADSADPTVYNNYSTVIDRLMNSAGFNNRPIIWLAPIEYNLIVPQNIEGAQAINTALQAAEDRYPNLWAVPTQQVWQQAFGNKCPVEVNQVLQLQPISECYANFGQNANLSKAGIFVITCLIIKIVKLELAGQARNETDLLPAPIG
jgi:hypothetical protein